MIGFNNVYHDMIMLLKVGFDFFYFERVILFSSLFEVVSREQYGL